MSRNPPVCPKVSPGLSLGWNLHHPSSAVGGRQVPWWGVGKPEVMVGVRDTRCSQGLLSLHHDFTSAVLLSRASPGSLMPHVVRHYFSRAGGHLQRPRASWLLCVLLSDSRAHGGGSESHLAGLKGLAPIKPCMQGKTSSMLR